MSTHISSNQPTQPAQWKYMRVLHDYDTPLDSIPEGQYFDPSELLSLREGDIILVYATHDNGWADGTILNNRQRGWFPANFCGDYSHEYTDPFFDAVAQIWASVTGDSSLQTVAKSQVESLAVGVRHLLKQTDCMRRGSPVIEAVPALYRHRMGLFTKLTELVKYADEIAHESAPADDDALWLRHTDSYMCSVTELCIKLLRFMDTWACKIELPCAWIPFDESRRSEHSASEQIPCRTSSLSYNSASTTSSLQNQPASTGHKPQPSTGSFLHDSMEHLGLKQVAADVVTAVPDETHTATADIETEESGLASKWPSLSEMSVLEDSDSSDEASTGATTPEQLQRIEDTRGKFLRTELEGIIWDWPVPKAYGNTDVLRYTEELVRDDDGNIIGGTPWSLALCLIYVPSGIPFTFLSIFMTFFHGFMHPSDLVSILVKQHERPYSLAGPPAEFRRRIVEVFEEWLSSHWDPLVDMDALAAIRQFALNTIVPLPKRSRHSLLRLINSASRMAENPYTSPCPGLDYLQLFAAKCSLVVPDAQSGTSQHAKLLDMSVTSMAQQLTVMALGLFGMVTRKDIIRCVERKATVYDSVVRAMSTFSTDLTNLVVHSIVTAGTMSVRQDMLTHWILVGISCLLMQNYESVMAITVGLEATPVARLHQTWGGLSEDMLELLKKLQNVTGTGRNFAVLRKFLKEKAATGPCVPFLGLILTDLTFVNSAAAETCVLNGIQTVNIDKHARLCAIMETIEALQRRPYDIPVMENVQQWFRVELETMQKLEQTEGVEKFREGMRQRSLIIEPRVASQSESSEGSSVKRISPSKRLLERMLSHEHSPPSIREIPKGKRVMRKLLSRMDSDKSEERP